MINKLKNYLGTGLKIMDTETGKERTLNAGPGASHRWIGIDQLCSYYETGQLTQLPLLRPLSKLTEEITVTGYNEGRSFIPMEELCRLGYCDGFMHMLNDEIYSAPLKVWELLHRWHFNLNFEEGEFIEI